MPYRRRRRPRYPRRPKRRPADWKSHTAKYAGKIGVIGAKAAAAYYLANKLNRQTNIEYKHHDESFGSQSINYSASTSSYILNDMSQGDTDKTRDGDSVKCQGVTLRGLLSRNGADSTVRMVLVWDKQNNVTPADIFHLSGQASAPWSNKAYDKRFQSRILYDRTFTIDTERPQINFHVKKRIMLHTQYDAGTITINTGVLRLFFISDKVTLNEPALTFTSRLTFTDN